MIQEFETNRIECDHPTAERIREIFRELPRKGCTTVSVTIAELGDILEIMEGVGFFGLMIDALTSDCQTLRVTAYKGKKGRCYDGGRRAELRGPATAVLDDDNHLIFGEIAVCEKTGGIYQLPIYAPFLSVSAGTDDLLHRLEDDPVVFDCDTFQDDVERLSSYGDWQIDSDADLNVVMYRGPFRVVLCKDGSIVRRGQPRVLPAGIVNGFSGHDSFLHLPKGEFNAAPAERFQDAFPKAGSLCLLGGKLEVAPSAMVKPLHLGALSQCSDPMIIRLLGMIERGDTHFILTGSDPDDERGCCPSVDVGEAFRLVDAGIIEAFRVPAPAETCTSTVFAYRGELQVRDGQPEFTPAAAFREQVKASLYSGQKKKDSFFPGRILSYPLLAFLFISLGVASAKACRSVSLARGATATARPCSFSKTLNLPDGVTVLLLRRDEECRSCRTAQRMCTEAIERFQKEGRAKGLRTETCCLATHRLLPLLKAYNLADTVSLLVLTISNGDERELTNLTPQFWNAVAGSDDFKPILYDAINRHRRDTH